MARSRSSTNRPDTFAQTQNTHHKDLACNLTADHTIPTASTTMDMFLNKRLCRATSIASTEQLCRAEIDAGAK